jgi:hypothetical protein
VAATRGAAIDVPCVVGKAGPPFSERATEVMPSPGAKRSTEVAPTLPQQTGLSVYGPATALPSGPMTVSPVMPTQTTFSARLEHGYTWRSGASLSLPRLPAATTNSVPRALANAASRSAAISALRVAGSSGSVANEMTATGRS